jgi:hypothetical protein
MVKVYQARLMGENLHNIQFLSLLLPVNGGRVAEACKDIGRCRLIHKWDKWASRTLNEERLSSFVCSLSSLAIDVPLEVHLATKLLLEVKALCAIS